MIICGGAYTDPSSPVKNRGAIKDLMVTRGGGGGGAATSTIQGLLPEPAVVVKVKGPDGEGGVSRGGGGSRAHGHGHGHGHHHQSSKHLLSSRSTTSVPSPQQCNEAILLPMDYSGMKDQVDEMTYGEALLRAMDMQVKLALQAQVGR